MRCPRKREVDPPRFVKRCPQQHFWGFLGRRASNPHCQGEQSPSMHAGQGASPVVRGDIASFFNDTNHVNQKHPSKRHAFREEKRTEWRGGSPPHRHPICCSHVRTASTYKLAIARDGCGSSRALDSPKCAGASVAGDGLSLVKPFSFSGFTACCLAFMPASGGVPHCAGIKCAAPVHVEEIPPQHRP